jgi:serine protease Do
VLGVNVSTDALQSLLPDLRIKTGVVIVARTAYGSIVDVGLQQGDVIHAVNATPVIALDDLRSNLAKLKSGDAVVLQIERNGTMDYLPFEME